MDELVFLGLIMILRVRVNLKRFESRCHWQRIFTSSSLETISHDMASPNV